MQVFCNCNDDWSNAKGARVLAPRQENCARCDVCNMFMWHYPLESQ